MASEIIKLLKQHLSWLVKGTLSKGQAWVEEAGAIIISANAEIKRVKEEKEIAVRSLKTEYDKAKAPFDKELKELDSIDKSLRERLLVEYAGADPIAVMSDDRIDGTIEFREKWGYEISDFARVPKDLLKTVVDEAKVQAMVDNGIRQIKGITIAPVRTVVVRVGKE